MRPSNIRAPTGYSVGDISSTVTIPAAIAAEHPALRREQQRSNPDPERQTGAHDNQHRQQEHRRLERAHRN